MKKIAIVLAIIFCVSAPVTAADVYYKLTRSMSTVFVNGKIFKSGDQPILSYKGVSYVPLQKFSTALGASVEVDSSTKAINVVTKTPAAPVQKKELSTEELAAKCLKSTVFIKNYNKLDMNIAQITSTGSGVVLPDYIVVSNAHVLNSGLRYGIQYNDTTEDLEYRTSSLLSIDANRDIGIIDSPNTETPPATLGDSDKLRVGQKVIAIGSPLGLKNTVSEGIISGFRTEGGYRYIQITAPISPGSSGGGLYDADGNLIGITTLKIVDGESLNFAIPINDVKKQLKEKNTALNIKLKNLLRYYGTAKGAMFFNYFGIKDGDTFRITYYMLESHEGDGKLVYMTEKEKTDLCSTLKVVQDSVTSAGHYKCRISLFDSSIGYTYNYETNSLDISK